MSRRTIASVYVSGRLRYAVRRMILGARIRLDRSRSLDLNGLFARHGVCREPVEVAFAEHLVAGGAIQSIVDVGANHGEFSLPLLRAGARCVLVEPNASLAARLVAATCDIEGATVQQVALGAEDAVDVLRVPAGHSGGAFLVGKDSSHGSGSRGRFVDAPVTVRRLDEVLESDRRIDLIKIDVEGAEPLVVAGSKSLIERYRPVVAFECGSAHELNQVRVLLPGYHFFAFDEYWPSGRGPGGFALGLLKWISRRRYALHEVVSISHHVPMVFAIPDEKPEVLCRTWVVHIRLSIRQGAPTRFCENGRRAEPAAGRTKGNKEGSASGAT